MKALEKPLDKYIKDKHTQEECIGFIAGFEASASLTLSLLEELILKWEKGAETDHSNDYHEEACEAEYKIADLKGVVEQLKKDQKQE